MGNNIEFWLTGGCLVQIWLLLDMMSPQGHNSLSLLTSGFWKDVVDASVGIGACKIS